MKVEKETKAVTLNDARIRLAETGGRISQDLGAGRIVGQILVYLYLYDGACSLDEIGHDLGLSKASVSVAARQLEKLGLANKVWKRGDRKNYYKSVDNIVSALQNGLVLVIQQKIKQFGIELDEVIELLAREDKDNAEIEFLNNRIERARSLQKRLERILNNPIVKLVTADKV